MSPTIDPTAAARLSHAGSLFITDLTTSEFVTLESLGFRPLDLVMGVSVFHVGWQKQNNRESEELTVLSEAMAAGRHNALTRMQAEADALGADGVVGVRVEWRQHEESPEHIEFIAVGTAVSCVAAPRSWCRSDGQAFTTRLNVHELNTLVHAGWAPVAFVLGTCVFHVAVQGFKQTMSQVGKNAEMAQWTQGNYAARETAMTRMQTEAETAGASGVIGVGFAVSSSVWGGHTLEFYCEGSSVRKFNAELTAPAISTVVTVP